MKIIFLLLIVSQFGCTNAPKDVPFSDPSLSNLIVREVLAKNRTNPVYLYTSNRKENIDYIIKYPCELRNRIRTIFYISDTGMVRKLLENSHFLDTTSEKFETLRFVDWKTKETADPRKLQQSTGGYSVINLFIMLYDNSRGKCIVYFHAVNAGTEIAFLEKKDNLWRVTSLETETLE